MQLLVLGGTAWLGQTVASSALERGYEVTCLARGESGPVPEGANQVLADRDEPDGHDPVAGRDWDAVVDVSRQPGQVRRAVAALHHRVGTYVFVSSCSVYARHDRPGEREDAELLPPLPGDVMETMETYGEAKVACEQQVRAGMGADRSLIVRAGLIGGPGDTSGRSGYWPLRFARPADADGRVLVPHHPDLKTQLIDVRDLADWMVRTAERRRSGVVNAVGELVPMAGFLEQAREVAGHTGPTTPVDQQWLLDHEVEPWMGPRSLPLWLPLPEFAGFSTRDGGAARAAGLVTRPLADTLADTLAWELERPAGQPRRAGLSDDEERALLSAARD